MKKITRFFLLISATTALRKVLKKSSLIGLGVLFSCLSVSAIDYCDFGITSNRGATAKITCHSLGGNLYEFKFETLTAITDWNKTGSNFYAEVNGIGGTQVSNNLVKTGDKLLTWTVTSTPKPNFYVGAFFVILGDGEHRFDIPTNEDFAAVCSTTEEDTEAPASFTASTGNISFNSVELLLNGTDNSGIVIYDITYGGTTVSTSSSSGVEKAYTVTGLSESTSYSFSITAKDPTGNTAANNPIIVNATTDENTNTECQGTSTEASQGSFTLGYNYKFTTSGTSVTAEFELLDTKDGVVAYAWTYNPGFAETAMTLVGGTTKKFTKTFTGQTIDAAFTMQCKFAYAGGMAVTKTYVYTVGNACISTETPGQDIQSFKMFPNPIQNNLLISTEKEMREVTVRNIVGQTVKTITTNGYERTIDLSELSGGNYIITVTLENGELMTKKIVKL